MMNFDFSKIKRTLESKSCPTHGEHPNVSVTGNKLSISCCCPQFKSAISRQAQQLMQTEGGRQAKDYAQRQIGDQLKKLFR